MFILFLFYFLYYTNKMKKKAINVKKSVVNETMDLSLLGLQEIPVKDIAALPKITKLDLSSNQISQLTDSFSQNLTHLTKLDLSSNLLTCLPDNFGLLVNLRSLDLSKNKLKSVPLTFGCLRVLNWLDLSENPLFPRISEIVGVCVNPSDCQIAAKKLVAFMDEVNKRVNNEIERIKEVKKVQAELAEIDMLKKKDKKEKKKKKKMAKVMENSNGKTDINDIENDVFKQQLHSYSQVPKAARPSLLWRCLATVFKLFFYVCLLSLLGIFVLRLVDEPTYHQLKINANNWATEASVHLPPGVIVAYNEGVKLSTLYCKVVWRRLVDFGQTVIVSVTEWYKWVSTDETVQLYMDSLWHFFHSCYVQLMDLSVNTFKKINDWIQS